MKFCTTFRHPNVVALGEIGLDYTAHFLDWPRQERQFLKLLYYANTKYVVVVLHLRDMSTDPAGREVYLHGMDLASKILQNSKRGRCFTYIFSLDLQTLSKPGCRSSLTLIFDSQIW